MQYALSLLQGSHTTRHGEIDGLMETQDSAESRYGFRIRGALGELLGLLVIALPTPEARLDLGSVHSLIKPALDCLQSELSARAAIGELHENLADNSRELGLFQRLSEAAAADVAEARVTLSTSVAAAYADLMRLTADRAAAADALRVRQESAALVADRVKQQLENVGQASEQNSRVASAEADVDVIDGQIARARNAIAALLGKGPDRGLDVALPQGVSLKAFGLPPSLAVDLVGRRPDIVAARLRAEAAASRIDVAHADYYPNIDLSGFYGVQSLGLSTLLQKSSIVGEIGPAIHLPIFDGGKIESGYRNARAEYDESVATYDKTLVHALQDVADAAADCRALAKQLAHSRAALAESENAYRIAKLRYQGGLSRYLDVLTAEDTLVTLRKQVADLEAEAFTQDVALVQALGGGFGANIHA